MNYDPYDPYCNETEDFTPKPDDLDKVDCAGCINSARCHAEAERIGIPVLLKATSLMTTSMSPIFKKPQVPKMRKIPSRPGMLPFILLLCAWGICTENITHQALWCICPVFVIVKAAKKLRLIFDGRCLNEHLHTPPPVALPTISDVFRRIGNRRVKVVILGDLRHYFHQFKIGPDLAGRLGVSVVDPDTGETKYFTYNTLPMGLSFSPWIAQSHSWLMLFTRQLGSSKLFNTEHFDDRLQQFVDIIDQNGNIVGFQTIVYDNFASFFFEDAPERTISDLQKRLIGNAKHLNFQWKELFAFDSRGAVNLLRPKRDASGKFIGDPSVPPIFLGVELDLIAERFQWRHAAKRVSKALELKRQLEFFQNHSDKCPSPRLVARAIGLLIWDFCVTLKQLGSLKLVIDETKHFHIKKKTDWDTKRIRPNPEWYKQTIHMLKNVIRNDWHTHYWPDENGPCILCVSDASDHWAGGYIFDEEDLFNPISIRYAERHDTHIFLKEVLACANTVARAVRFSKLRYGDTIGVTIKIAVDNNPARRCFERGYSSNSIANRIVTRTMKLIEEARYNLSLVDIASEHNVADCLTRQHGEKGHDHSIYGFCADKLERSFQIVTGRMPGRDRPSTNSKKISEDPIFNITVDELKNQSDWLQDLMDADLA